MSDTLLAIRQRKGQAIVVTGNHAGNRKQGAEFVMWICTNTGFLSVVVDETDTTRLLVRARRKIDLQNVVGDVNILETPERDYRWRTFIDREKFKEIVAARIDAISYTNFKDSVPGEYRQLHDMYTDFWMTHRSYQDKDPATRKHRQVKSKADRSGHLRWDAGDIVITKAEDEE
jgi:hypothetical protein